MNFISSSDAKLKFGTNVFENSKFSLIVITGNITLHFVIFDLLSPSNFCVSSANISMLLRQNLYCF